MLKSFWQNLGLSYKDILSIPSSTSDLLCEIMNIEEQYQRKEIDKRSHG